MLLSTTSATIAVTTAITTYNQVAITSATRAITSANTYWYIIVVLPSTTENNLAITSANVFNIKSQQIICVSLPSHTQNSITSD